VDFGLSEAEQARLYMALQLQAQQALETIRSRSEMAGLDQLSEDEINAEIQAERHEAANPPSLPSLSSSNTTPSSSASYL